MTDRPPKAHAPFDGLGVQLVLLSRRSDLLSAQLVRLRV